MSRSQWVAYLFHSGRWRAAREDDAVSWNLEGITFKVMAGPRPDHSFMTQALTDIQTGLKHCRAETSPLSRMTQPTVRRRRVVAT